MAAVKESARRYVDVPFRDSPCNFFGQTEDCNRSSVVLAGQVLVGNGVANLAGHFGGQVSEHTGIVFNQSVVLAFVPFTGQHSDNPLQFIDIQGCRILVFARASNECTAGNRIGNRAVPMSVDQPLRRIESAMLDAFRLACVLP